MKKIKVIHIDAEKQTVSLIEVENELRPLQDLVGGNLEVAPVSWVGGIDLLVDEEGLLKSLDHGFSYEGVTFAGNGVVVGVKDGEWKDVAKTKAQSAAILLHFKEGIVFLKRRSDNMVVEKLIEGMKRLNREELLGQVNKLPERERLILSLLFFEKDPMSLADVATILNRVEADVQEDFIAAMRKIIIFTVKK